MNQNLPLQMVYRAGGADAARQAQTAIGWRVRGLPLDWLTEVAGWPIAHAMLRFLPLPTSASNREANGALVTGALADAALPDDFRPGPRCIEYRCRARRFWMPMEAELRPQVAEAELSDLLSSRVYVWTPDMGLIAFDEQPWLSADALLSRPLWSKHRWLPSPHPVEFAPRIFALGAELPPDANQLEQWQDDIGTKSDQAGELPRTSDESQPGALGAAQVQGKKLAANAAKMAAGMLPTSWAERLGAWGDKQQQEVDRTAEADQNRELERLMKMLHDNPDEGLKYAPPLGDHDAHRGLADSQGPLTERNTNFNLGRINTGGPASSWSVSDNNYYRLRQQYHEAANRELQLKRYRRAAYVFAELLGDYRAAAGALVTGGHYRDAAALYRQKLASTRQAAECLEQGGMVTEAIEAYVEIEAFEKAGDLYAGLNQPLEAERHYRKAVEQMRASPSQQHLAIARLLELKLDAPAEAMSELLVGWPQSGQAAQRMKDWFRIADSLPDVSEAEVLSQIDRLGTLAVAHAQLGGDLLAELAMQSDFFAASHARRRLTQLISKRAMELPLAQRAAFFQLLQRTAPSDRLLVRDCRTFIDPAQGASRAARVAGQVVEVKAFQLNKNAHWKKLCRVGDTVLAAGVLQNAITLTPIIWSSNMIERRSSQQLWPDVGILPAADVSLSANEAGDAYILLQALGHQPLEPREIVLGNDKVVKIGSGGGYSASTIASVRGEGGMTLLLDDAATHCVLTRYRGDEPVASDMVCEEEMPPDHRPQVACSTGSDRLAYVSWGDLLFTIPRGTLDSGVIPLPQHVRRVACGPQLGEVAVAYEMGGALIWERGGRLSSFGDGLADPEICFNRSSLMVAGTKRLEVYSTSRAGLSLVAELERAELDPIAVTSGPHRGEFVVLNRNGAITLYRHG